MYIGKMEKEAARGMYKIQGCNRGIRGREDNDVSNLCAHERISGWMEGIRLEGVVREKKK